MSSYRFKVCSVEGCNRNAHYLAKGAMGMCQAHYGRLHNHGDPLHGGPLGTPRGAAMRFILDVAIQYSGNDCLVWPFGKDADGYGKLRVNEKTVRAHRYVCTLAHGEPPTPEHEAAHSCGKGHLSCVTKSHLSWKTPSENQADRIIHGTDDRGERSATAKLTEDDVRKIRSLRGVKTQKEIAAEFCVATSSIANVQAGRTWACLLSNFVPADAHCKEQNR